MMASINIKYGLRTKLSIIRTLLKYLENKFNNLYDYVYGNNAHNGNTTTTGLLENLQRQIHNIENITLNNDYYGELSILNNELMIYDSDNNLTNEIISNITLQNNIIKNEIMELPSKDKNAEEIKEYGY